MRIMRTSSAGLTDAPPSALSSNVLIRDSNDSMVWRNRLSSSSTRPILSFCSVVFLVRRFLKEVKGRRGKKKSPGNLIRRF